MTVAMLTTSAHPEMADYLRWLVGRQTATTWSVLHRAKTKGNKKDRSRALATMIHMVGDPFFMLVDDDDYMSADYVEHCLDNIGDLPLWGEIPKRVYHLPSRTCGSAPNRRRLFHTFTVYRTDPMRVKLRDAFYRGEEQQCVMENTKFKPQHSERLVIMRGMMDDPKTAITRRKNVAKFSYPDPDPDLKILREWTDEEMVARCERWFQ